MQNKMMLYCVQYICFESGGGFTYISKYIFTYLFIILDSIMSEKKLILWAVPRSISTAFFRAMMNRRSTKVEDFINIK